MSNVVKQRNSVPMKLSRFTEQGSNNSPGFAQKLNKVCYVKKSRFCVYLLFWFPFEFPHQGHGHNVALISSPVWLTLTVMVGAGALGVILHTH